MPPRALTLSPELLEQVAAGRPVLDLESLPAPTTGLDPGRPLRLVDTRGTTLATALADPENGCLRILSTELVDTFDLDFFSRRVAAALRLRVALGLVAEGSAYRLLNGEGDQLSGFVADVYGDYAVLYVYSRGLLTLGRLVAEAILGVTEARGVVLKVRPRGGPKPGKVRQEVLGESPPERYVVRERGVPFEVHLLGGLNVGLFTDMREHRRGIGRFVRGRRVLNTFAYTGAISVAAALAGATEVTSVDLSSGVLKWAKENFRLSGLDPESAAYRFEASDVLRFVRQEAEREATYDAVILDPPTYSAARASAWSMKKDYPELIALAAGLLPADQEGFLWISANVHRSRALTRMIEEGIRRSGRTARILEVGGLPPDYPTPLEYPEGRYLQVCQVAVRERAQAVSGW